MASISNDEIFEANMLQKKILIPGISIEMGLMMLLIFGGGIFMYTLTDIKIPFPFNSLPISKHLFKILIIVGGGVGVFMFSRMAFKPMAVLEDREISIYLIWKFKWKKYFWDQIRAIKSQELPFAVLTSLSFKKDGETLKIFSGSPQYFEFLNFLVGKVGEEKMDVKTIKFIKEREAFRERINRFNRQRKTYFYGILVLILGLVLLHFLNVFIHQ